MHGPAALLLAAALGAQGVTYSPAIAPTGFGYDEEPRPFSDHLLRYQQIHGDVRGAARLIREIAFRRSYATALPGGTARSVDAELWIGESDFATASDVFSQNFASAPTLGIARKLFSLPNIVARNPDPRIFAVNLLFDRPWGYSGTRDLVWELQIHGSNSATAYVLEAQREDRTLAAFGVNTGCVARGQSAPMQLDASVTALRSTMALHVSWTCRRTPFHVPACLFVGARYQHASLPGLCTSLGSVETVFTWVGITTGDRFDPPGLQIPYRPGLELLQPTAQVVALDATQAGLPLALSQATLLVIPDPPPLGTPVRRVHAPSPTAFQGSLDARWYSLITRFQH